MVIDSGKRFIRTHPHKGRTFVVGDTFTVLDAWEAADAYGNALQYGSQWVNDSGIAWNPGSWRNNTPPNTDSNMHHEPPVGMSGGPSLVGSATTAIQGYRYITPRYATYLATYGGEINSQHDSFALGLDFRFLSPAEFATSAVQPNSAGIGARAQRLTISLTERSGSVPQNQVLIDIFYDWSYYQANVSIAIPAQNSTNVIDLAQGSSPFEQDGAINQALIVDKIGALLRKTGSAAATLLCKYELPLSPNGGSWNVVSSVFDYIGCEPITHPNSGIECYSWGLLAITMTNFRSDTFSPTILASGANARTQLAFPTTGDAVMGQNLDGLLFTDLYNRGRAAAQVSWPAVCLGRRSFGGLNRILVGDAARYQAGGGASAVEWAYDDHASQVLDLRCQIPSAATRFTLHTYVKYQAGAGLHTIKFELIRDYTDIFGGNAQATQVLYTASFASNFGPDWVWVDQALNAAMIPNQGQVEHVQLKVTVTKSAPRNTDWGYLKIAPDLYHSQPCANFGSFDGVGAIYLAFR